jgi:hypothetical protein
VAIKYGQSRETGNTTKYYFYFFREEEYCDYISYLYELTGQKTIIVYAMNEQQFS